MVTESARKAIVGAGTGGGGVTGGVTAATGVGGGGAAGCLQANAPNVRSSRSNVIDSQDWDRLISVILGTSKVI